MGTFSWSRRRRSKRKSTDPTEGGPSPGAADGSPYVPHPLRIHRMVRQALDRIKVPEPQPFVPDPFQVEALEALRETDVLVTAPTGSGKTYIAVQAIEKTFREGGRCWYASPLKALSNAKYVEFGEVFGPDNVGILTGDRKENSQAPIIVGTTEILRNQLYDTMHQGIDLTVDLVILDEAHYLGDTDRGVVWEEVLIYLPARVKLLLLSATIRNGQELCDWLKWMRSMPCSWVKSFERPVPLFPLYLFPDGDLSALGGRRGLLPRIRQVDPRSFSKGDFIPVRRVLDALRQANLLPAIFFLKSRSDCEKSIQLCGPSPADGGTKSYEEFQTRLDELLEAYPFLGHHQHLPILRRSRVGAHHGGQLPHWKILLERLMQEGYLEAIFSTSTVAAGVNFPARTVVVPQSDRFNGREFVDLSATDLLQMTGRAGRRGMDEIGFVLVLPGVHQDPLLIHNLLRSPPDPIVSQIRINHSMVLNLLLSHAPDEIQSLFAASLATYQNLSQEAAMTEEFQLLRDEAVDWYPEMACGSMESLAQVRPRYGLLKESIRKARKLLKRQTGFHAFQDLLTPGRVFRSKRGTPYVVVSEPEMEFKAVRAVRLAVPLCFRKGRIKPFRVNFRRIRAFGERLDELPAPKDRDQWLALALAMAGENAGESAPPLSDASTPAEETSGEVLASTSQAESTDSAPRIELPLPQEATSQGLSDLLTQLDSLPCNRCAQYAPCQKGTAHPFASFLVNYFEQANRVRTIQEQLWLEFQRHYRFLQEEGYVDPQGHLTGDGLWASKLRLDQPLLISECIRKDVFPTDNPPLLAALIAPFVMDRDRPGDAQLSTLIWKNQEVAQPFFAMLRSLQRLREHLQTAGFHTPPLPFWTVVTVYHWAQGVTWEELRTVSGMDEGDLAMVILRSADHLRQIESLQETHPQLATSARRAIDLILREPVAV
ncbi:MAG: DEAD/DEAH box helicase [Syntrophobacteraceae bacterium]